MTINRAPLLFAMLLVFCCMLPAWAAPSTDWNAEDFPEVDLPPPENEPPQADAVPEMTYRISRSIHCPVCRGAHRVRGHQRLRLHPRAILTLCRLGR